MRHKRRARRFTGREVETGLEPDLSKIDPPKTLWMHVRKVAGDMNRARPASAYLLIAIVVVLLLGQQIVYVRSDPRRYAFFLSLLFVFFFVVIFRAVIDCVEIAKRHFSEREKLFQTTIGEKDFAAELGRRVAENRHEE
jgi:hypothetical protein